MAESALRGRVWCHENSFRWSKFTAPMVNLTGRYQPDKRYLRTIPDDYMIDPMYVNEARADEMKQTGKRVLSFRSPFHHCSPPLAGPIRRLLPTCSSASHSAALAFNPLVLSLCSCFILLAPRAALNIFNITILHSGDRHGGTRTCR